MSVRLFGQKELRQVGRHVRQAREKAGLTQSQLADSAGISSRAVRELEAGRSNPTLATMVAIVDVLAFTLDELVIAARTSLPGPDLTLAGDIGPGSNPLSRTLPNPRMSARIVDFGGDGPGDQDVPAAAVFGHVLGGSVTVSLDGEEITLRQGDSLHARSGVVRHWHAHGDRTRMLLVEAGGEQPDGGV